MKTLIFTRYVYILSEPGLWTVGFYDPAGNWNPESDWENREDAAKRVHYLNGGDLSGENCYENRP